MTEPKKV